MYNTDAPVRAELPSSQQLARSTLIAVVAAAAILLTVVLPAEYGIDPTRVGRVLGLTEMGEIKRRLAAEAAADTAPAATAAAPEGTPAPVVTALPSDRPAAAASGWRDEMRLTLTPKQGVEVKLRMNEGERAQFSWAVDRGVVNYDTHGDGGGRKISYVKGRGVPRDEGELVAAFTGNHGWFWRNRGDSTVTLVLRTRGQYRDVKRVD